MDNNRQANKRPNFGSSQEISKKKRSSEKEIYSSHFEFLIAEEEELISNKVWNRPEAANLDPSKDSLVFQQLEIEEYSHDPPAIYLYGITDLGNTVFCQVEGFLPYFYVPAPIGFTVQHLEEMEQELKKELSMNAIALLSLEERETLWGYHGTDRTNFVKISLTQPRHLAPVKRVFERGFQLARFNMQFSEQTFESNIEYLLRFMIDTKITGGNWIELPPGGKYRLDHEQKSTCQYQVVVHYADLISHPPEGEWSRIAPIRTLSFDIECAGRKGIFPEPKEDPVIQIANIVTIHGQEKPFIRNVFVLRSCSPIAGAQVLSFNSEAEMLNKWREFLLCVDPDLIIGYNISNFDFPYLLDRARFIQANNFPYLGRLHGRKSEIKDTTFSSKAYGKRESKAVNLEGRLQFDMLQVMQRDYKLRSYSLNSVCAEFLNEQKEDVPHSIITDLHNGNEETRRRLAVYCLKDAYLPMRLMEKLMCLYNYLEMARVTGVPFSYLLSRGQQIKVISQLYRKANEQAFVVPSMRADVSEEQYEGATVIEPKKGFYNCPIATLDFASLYPSIMMAHNLCYTTLLNKATIEKLGLSKEKDYIVTPLGDAFVKTTVRKGLLPTILQDLLSARKKAKQDLKKETDPFKKAVLDGRQLALKISANSVYGFTGATVGKLPCLQISAGVTAYGREMIEKTKQEVEQHFNPENGYPFKADVIYGDTDSVMIKFGVETLEEAMKLGNEAAGIVTAKFIKPIKLEFEKVYFPYLLINKKRYAGLYWTNTEKYDKMDMKGIETVRRDNCKLVQTVVDTCLRKILIERDVAAAQEFVKETISDLLQNKVDMSQLVISKALSKTDYDNKQAHVELAKRMRKRDAGSAPALGDRVPYVIIQGAKGAKAYETAEDPYYVLENSIPINTQYYLDNQLRNPLTRIFEPILGSRVEQLFTGVHTMTVSISKSMVGGLTKFTKTRASCLGCKASLKPGDSGALCEHCKPDFVNIHQKYVENMNILEMKYSRLWTQCQRCQGSLHQDVLCTSRDCPIFYMRKKAQKEVKEITTTMERFNLLSW